MPRFKNFTPNIGPSNRSLDRAVFPLKKSKFALTTKKGKLAAAIKQASIHALKPLDGKPLCLKAQLEEHNQKVRTKLQPTATITSGAFESSQKIKPVSPLEPPDADEIELSILDKDLLISDSDPEKDTQPNRGLNATTENTATVLEVVGKSATSIDQHTTQVCVPIAQKKRKRSSSHSSGSSSSSSSSSGSSTSSSSTTGSSASTSSKKSKRIKPDSTSSSASNSPKVVNKTQVLASSDSEDIGSSLSNKLNALADAIISSTTDEPKLTARVTTVHETIGPEQTSFESAVQKTANLSVSEPQLALGIIAKATNIIDDSTKLTPSAKATKLISITRHSPNRDPRVTSVARLPQDIKKRITPIAPNRSNYSAIRERVERNISDSLGQSFRLPCIEPLAPRVHSPTFARFNPGLVYLPPRPEPVPNITINNNYYGGNPRGYNRGHFRGSYRNRGSAGRESYPTTDQDQPFKVLSGAEINSLSRGQKRRYFKKLGAQQLSTPDQLGA